VARTSRANPGTMWLGISSQICRINVIVPLVVLAGIAFSFFIGLIKKNAACEATYSKNIQRLMGW
jgi:hypothetical protein